MGQPKKGDLSENEKKLMEKASKGTLEEVKLLLKEPDVRVDCLDESGMTPLLHAAFRDQYEIAQLLLAHGADVNTNYHENGYTSLMFAALSGSPEMTRLMLVHGARKDRVNSVGRNAAQMAAFVGQHFCVSIINNFYGKEELEYFTQIQGLEKEPKLPYVLVPSLLKLLNSSNMHPVKLSLLIRDNPGLLEESYKVCKVLDIICEKAMKSRDTDDVTAMKANYFATLLRHAKEAKDINAWLKSLIKGREEDGFPEIQDRLIRQALKDFPYIESQLLQSMVHQLAKTKIGEHPSALNVLMQGVNGQKFTFDEYESCMTCGELKAERKCSACRMAYYCNQECQKLHWPNHKKYCKELAGMYAQVKRRKELEALQAQKEKELAALEEKKRKAEQEQTPITDQEKQPEQQSEDKENKTEDVDPNVPKIKPDSKAEKALAGLVDGVEKTWADIKE